MKVCSADKTPILAMLFSAAVFREMAKQGRSRSFVRLLTEADIITDSDRHKTVGEIFDAAFEAMQIVGHRYEYVYRSAMVHRALTETQSIRTVSILNEFRVGNSKADLVILDNTASVYEIKSERDSLARLANQVDNYKRVFAKVHVIASEDHIAGVLKTVADDVGLMCLNSHCQVTTVREALERPERTNPVVLFESLRLAEAIAILQAIGVVVPEVPNTQRHTVMREIFGTIDSTATHAEMVKTLKHTRNQASLGDFLAHLPKSLQAAALMVSVRRSEYSQVISAIKTPLHQVMDW